MNICGMVGELGIACIMKFSAVFSSSAALASDGVGFGRYFRHVEGNGRSYGGTCPNVCYTARASMGRMIWLVAEPGRCNKHSDMYLRMPRCRSLHSDEPLRPISAFK